ncbi:unnamed protein product [Dovyalis caffra]|uniref:MI domain-containing protein n=1 Tax=Dovyalis caffra TaxID=77055 RepID=A0AAV1S3L7_9ROSI|nr:unnamed protein product [Dovyalis caffra]
MARKYSSSSESSDDERDGHRRRDSKRDSKSDSRHNRGSRGDESDESLDKRHDKRDERSRPRDRNRDGERFSRERKEARESSEEEGELVERDRKHEGRRETREREKEKEKVNRSSDEEDDRREKERREREKTDRRENGHRRRENEDGYRSRDRQERRRALDFEDDDIGLRRKSERDRDRRRRDRDYDSDSDRRNERGKERNERGKEGRSLKQKEDGHRRAVEQSKPRRETTVQEGNQGTDASVLGKTGGVYIPPYRLARMMKEVEDKSGVEYQRLTWDALRKSINGLVNKVNASNIKNIIPELFSENLIRGRGLFCRSCMKSQMASPRFTDVFAALVAVVNTKFPEVGDLLLRRIVLQLKRAFKRNDKPQLLAAVKFIAHLVNQQVAHEIIALELLAVLLENPTDDSVEVAVGFVTECGSMLQDVSPKGLDGAFERFRGILHEGEIDKRVQFLIEGLFAIRKAKFQVHSCVSVDIFGYPAVRPELDLVDQEDQLTHEISLSEDIDAEITLDIFKPDPNFLENEKRYEELKKSILGEESEDEDGSDAASGDDDDDDDNTDDDEESEEEDEEQMRIDDQTETNLINLRRTIYLTIMSSVDFEEAGHKLLKIKLEPGQEMELCIMLLECCSQERTYLRYYGLLGQRFCMINKVHQENFEKCFVQQYSMIHRLETNKLRNVAKFFAHLLGTDALPWHVLAYIRLTEEDTTSSSRIFIKILFQELSEHLGIRTLNERLTDPTMIDSFESIFPRDNPKNTRFAINFFTSIGLGGITENLRDYLKNMPRMIMQQQEQVSESGSGSDDESGSSSSSDSDSSSSGTESDSSSSDEDERHRKRLRSSRRDERHRKRIRALNCPVLILYYHLEVLLDSVRRGKKRGENSERAVFLQRSLEMLAKTRYVKKVIEEKTGLESEKQKILFRGNEKEDGENLQEAGVKNKSKILVLEEVRKEKKLEEMKGSEETSKGPVNENGEEMSRMEVKGNEQEMAKAFQAIAETRAEIDKLAERVAALEVAVNGGTKVSEDELVVCAEMLMRQLLKLDTVEAEGEARIQRKAEELEYIVGHATKADEKWRKEMLAMDECPKDNNVELLLW